MTYTFESCFAARIEDFIAQKNALGFGYLESSRLLRDFDRFCMTHFPEENFLTEELCLAWATKKNTEGNNTFRNRMMPVREFARYLNRNGEASYVLPPDIARKDAPYAPYNKFLMHYLNSPFLNSVITENIGGSASPHINVGDIKKFLIPVPDINEQDQTVQIIESRLSVCESIEQTVDTALAQADAMRQSILKQAFEGGVV